jgi:hypothetical protein
MKLHYICYWKTMYIAHIIWTEETAVSVGFLGMPSLALGVHPVPNKQLRPQFWRCTSPIQVPEKNYNYDFWTISAPHMSPKSLCLFLFCFFGVSGAQPLAPDLHPGGSLAGGLRCEVEASENSTTQSFQGSTAGYILPTLGLEAMSWGLKARPNASFLERLGFQFFWEGHVLHNDVLSVGLRGINLDCGKLLGALFLHTEGRQDLRKPRQKCQAPLA